MKENIIRNIAEIHQSEIRPYQINFKEACELKVIDLFNDTDVNSNQRLLSRADLVLIFSLYDNGLKEFLGEYRKYISDLNEKKGYTAVPKPHYFLKNILG
ncbi:MAG: hypothetical protein RR620_08410 [Clostridium sp.]